MLDEIFATTAVFFDKWTWLIVLFAASYLLLIWVKNWWLMKIRRKFINEIKWINLEIKIPKENLRSPKSMEQVFASLYATYSFGFKWIDKWWFGKVEEWMSFEMVGFAQGMHFYAYIPEKHKPLVESAFFAQYPETEIHVTEDYVRRFGGDLPNDTFDIFGADFILARENYYPIKTYQFFEDIIEERRLDPIATISETMAGLKDDEMIWLEILIRPTGDNWKTEAEEVINKVMGRNAKTSGSGIVDVFMEFLKNLIWAPAKYPVWSGGGGEAKPSNAARLSPGEQDFLKAVENKTSKPGFETILRFIYLDKKDSFTGSNVSAVMGAINQFRTQNLNSFRPNPGTITVPRAVGLFYRIPRLLRRKKKLFKSYLDREMPLEPKRPFSLRFKTCILSVEELATIYHPPITIVGATSLERLEAKKGSAPSSLPIIG